MKKHIMFSLFAVLVSILSAQDIAFENITIDKDCFKGWSLSGNGTQNPDGSIAVTGDGNNCTYWLSNPLDLKAGQTYMVRFLRRNGENSGGLKAADLTKTIMESIRETIV